MNCLHKISRVPLTSAFLPAYITLADFPNEHLHMISKFLHELSSHDLQVAPYFSIHSCIHHIGRFSPVNISQMNSKVLITCAFFLAYITVGESSFMNSLHMNSEVPLISAVLPAYITVVKTSRY